MAPTDRHRHANRDEDAAPDPVEFVQELVGSVTDYARAEGELLKLRSAKRAGDITGRIVLVVALVLLLNGVVLMLSVAWGIWLGQRFQDPALGFLLAGGTYVLLIGLFYLIWRLVLRDRITLAIVNAAHAED
ncbi:MAG: hypothetical protein IPL52_00450 [Flavobacteriales bacterium]|nr:hypothetical protein [Flavobacteriales bacterium]